MIFTISLMCIFYVSSILSAITCLLNVDSCSTKEHLVLVAVSVRQLSFDVYFDFISLLRLDGNIKTCQNIRHIFGPVG